MIFVCVPGKCVEKVPVHKFGHILCLSKTSIKSIMHTIVTY